MWWKNIGILILDRLGLQVKKKPKINPDCSVARCRAKAPHLNDPVVVGLVHNFSDLAKVAHWTCACIAELGKSMADDIAAGRRFALITRTRVESRTGAVAVVSRWRLARLSPRRLSPV